MHVLFVGVGAFALRVALIVAYPFVYGGDPIIRLIESDRILISYQLPGLQVIIYLIHKLGGGVPASRLMVAALSALAAAGLCRLVATRWSRTVAILSGLIFACNPFVVFFSTVPYQFPLVLAAAHWGLYFYVRGGGRLRWTACSVCFGIACLTRYEAWMFAVCLAAAWILCPKREPAADSSLRGPRRGSKLAARLALRVLIGAVLFGWAPIVWLVIHRGISPAGTFVAGGLDEWGQLLRPLTTGLLVLGLSGAVAVALIIVGLAQAWRELRGPRRSWWIFAAVWVVCSSVGLVFSAHPVQPPSSRLAAVLGFVGIEPTPAMFVTPREGHLYVSLLSILAALGVARIGQFRMGCDRRAGQGESKDPPVVQRPAWRAPAAYLAAMLLIGHSVWTAAHRIERAGRDPELQTAVAAAHAVDALLDEGGQAVVLARPIPSQDINDYLERARRAGGAAGQRRAEEILAMIETGPPAYQRMVVHSRYDRKRLLDIDDLGESSIEAAQAMHFKDVRYCVFFNDFAARSDIERAVAAVVETGRLLFAIETGVGAKVYAIPSGAR